MFQAPVNWESYYDNIILKCEGYIDSGYWEEIDKIKLRGWLTNFKTAEERYFSACMLDALVFRTRKMVDASFRDIASSKIPKFLYQNGVEINDNLDNWIDRITAGDNVPFRFIAIENVDNKTGKSGSLVIRSIKESLDLAGHLTPPYEKIPKIPKDVNFLVFVDDFAGTGEQFDSFFKEKIKPLLRLNMKILYTPLAAHKRAIEYIKNKNKQVTILPVETLSDEDSFFHPINNSFRGDGKNTVEDAKKFYLNICRKNGFENERYLLGKGDQSLCFAFYFSTPNNNLKLLYHKKPGHRWINLLHRNR
ncbi:phosphoribosyltransferase-like protein [Zobellella denitrificans]